MLATMNLIQYLTSMKTPRQLLERSAGGVWIEASFGEWTQ